MVDALDRGRECFGRREWGDAYARLCAADSDAPLEIDDLERLAVAAYLVGNDDASADAWLRAHHECQRLADPARAARCAFWLGFGLLNQGEVVQGSGWFTRARRLIDEGHLDCVAQGYLLVPVALEQIEHDAPAALATFRAAAEIGERFRDPDLTMLGLLGRGQALIRMGRLDEGMAVLDELMVTITADEASPLIVGLAYCGVIETCRDVFDLRRAQEWTVALSRWCETQPDLVLYRGQCLLHRAEIMQLRGAWRDAMDETERACEQLSAPPPKAAVGAAHYQQAELHRLRGERAPAEAAYRRASQWGRTPHPGLAQLRLAQGQLEAAVAAIRREVDEAPDRVERSKLLPAYVEIMLAANDVAAARAAADELTELARTFGTPYVHAVAAHAIGIVLMAEGDVRGALAALRRAWTAWRDLDAPYEAARIRVQLGLGCAALGDADTAEMEYDAARWVFQQLGAGPDLVRLDEISRSVTRRAADPLSAREVEVLVLVASGKTNRAIAAELVISEKTVARHVSNILTKLGVASRSAATAYAYEHGLV